MNQSQDAGMRMVALAHAEKTAQAALQAFYAWHDALAAYHMATQIEDAPLPQWGERLLSLWDDVYLAGVTLRRMALNRPSNPIA